MAGEMIKTEATCLWIRPWSRTSHVTGWLTPSGTVSTVVKGAVRPKSFFLGQYDLNFTCEILYYARAHGDLHALRECTPLERRDFLRGDYRALVTAERYRHLAGALAPAGPESREWFEALGRGLDALAGAGPDGYLPQLLAFEKKVLALSGVWPEIPANGGEIALSAGRTIPVPPATAAALADPDDEKNSEFLLDAARVVGVLYTTNLELPPDPRRAVLKLICKPEQGQKEKT